jgi:hypothetical protein
MTAKEVFDLIDCYDPVVIIKDLKQELGSTRINTWMGTNDDVDDILSMYSSLKPFSCLIDGATIVLINQ